jgi:hypothetical protein
MCKTSVMASSETVNMFPVVATSPAGKPAIMHTFPRLDHIVAGKARHQHLLALLMTLQLGWHMSL